MGYLNCPQNLSKIDEKKCKNCKYWNAKKKFCQKGVEKW